MSYTYETNPITNQQEIVISGWEKGIADSPYQGISDMRNVNIISIPGEASINFSTAKISSPTVTTGTVVSASAGGDYITYTGATGGLEGGMAVTFVGASLPAGITAGVVYWVNGISGGTLQLYSDITMNNLVNITGSGTGTFTTFVMATQKHYSYNNVTNTYWLIDSSGRVWTNEVTTLTNNYWVYAGNTVDLLSNGNGIVYFEDAKVAAGSHPGYIFIFRNSGIDYTSTGTISWQYGWHPTTGVVTGTITGSGTGYLNAFAGINTPHNTLVGPGNTVYYCDTSFVSSWFQTDATVAFDPTNTATYTFEAIAIETELFDTNNCLAILGENLLIGGIFNIIYVWDRVSTLYQYRIYLAESLVSRMETINTTTYIFTGNRGRIYYTNGSNATLYKKVPDHLSNTVEPYFTWGGTASYKNQLYFGVSATNNAGTAITNYGGLWAIDVDTKAMRLTNQLSYGDYTGRATLIIPQYPYYGNPTGTGLYIGWIGGLDQTVSSKYTNYQTYVDSDIIPVGNYQVKKTFSKLEFKLTTPMTVANEGIKISYRTNITEAYTQIGETLYSATADTNMSDVYDINFQNVQWIQFRVNTKCPAITGSYVRLREIRLKE